VKILGSKKLIKQLGQLPLAARQNIVKGVKRNTEATARVARTLAPNVTGRTKDDIFTIYDVTKDGVSGSVEAAQPTKEAQKRARAIEFGRTNGEHGTTPPQPYIRPASAYMRKRYTAAMRRLVKKAAKDTFNG
jgi:hypothetical protein